MVCCLSTTKGQRSLQVICYKKVETESSIFVCGYPQSLRSWAAFFRFLSVADKRIFLL